MLVITAGLPLFCSSTFAAPAGKDRGLEGCLGGLTFSDTENTSVISLGPVLRTTKKTMLCTG